LWMGLSSTKPGGSLKFSSLAPGYVADLTKWHTLGTISICYGGEWAWYYISVAACPSDMLNELAGCD
jgi:hypothetical protein